MKPPVGSPNQIPDRRTDHDSIRQAFHRLEKEGLGVNYYFAITNTASHETFTEIGVRMGLLGNAQKSARGRGMQRRPPLVVPSVHVGPSLHQKLHHFQVVINAGLKHK